MTYNVFSGTLNPTHFTSLRLRNDLFLYGVGHKTLTLSHTFDWHHLFKSPEPVFKMIFFWHFLMLLCSFCKALIYY